MSDFEYQSGDLIFEWDSDKAERNWQKHNIRFEDATKVFEDENRIDYRDEEHSDYEDRYITIGRVDKILFVVYTDREDRTRIISARKANKPERRMYYGNSDIYFA